MEGTMKFSKLVAGAAAVLSAFGMHGASAQDKITVGLVIPMTAPDGPIYTAAKTRGFFGEERLDVEWLLFQGAGIALPQVAAKKVTIALPVPEPVIASYEPGKSRLPVSFFYNATPYNYLEVVVLESSPYKTLADLKGQKIGTGALTWGTVPQTRAMLRSVGYQPGKDFEIVAVGVLGSGFNALRNGSIAALNYYVAWHQLLELEGTKIRRLPYPPEYRQMVSVSYVAHEDTIKNQPDVLTRFGRAIAKATVFCDENPVPCIHDFWKEKPESKPKNVSEEVALKNTLFLFRGQTDPTLRKPDGTPRRMGAFVMEDIRAYVNALHRDGELSTKDIPVERIFTNALVDGFNKFDEKAIRAHAKAAK
jgi:NitT/TauT family transport system substrate-binding protein